MKYKVRNEYIAPFAVDAFTHSVEQRPISKPPLSNDFFVLNLNTSYRLISQAGIETPFIKPLVVTEIDLSEKDIDILKKLIKVNRIDESYLGELGWYFIKAKEFSFKQKQSKEHLRHLLIDCYLSITFIKDVESNETTIIAELYKLWKSEKDEQKKKLLREKIEDLEKEKVRIYQKYANLAENLSDKDLISIIRKTYKDLQILEDVLFEFSNVNEIIFTYKRKKGESIRRFDKRLSF